MTSFEHDFKSYIEILLIFSLTSLKHANLYGINRKTKLMPSSQKIFRGRPNNPVGQPILVQPKYNPT